VRSLPAPARASAYAAHERREADGNAHQAGAGDGDTGGARHNSASGRQADTAITAADLRALRAARVAASQATCAATKRHDAKRGEAGANRLKQRVRHLFTWTIEHDHVTESPFRKGHVTIVKANRDAETPRDRRLTGDEERRLLAAANPRLFALIVAALTTGCRKGELLNMRWAQVRETPKPEIRLSASNTKTDKARTVPLTARLKAAAELDIHVIHVPAVRSKKDSRGQASEGTEFVDHVCLIVKANRRRLLRPSRHISGQEYGDKGLKASDACKEFWGQPCGVTESTREQLTTVSLKPARAPAPVLRSHFWFRGIGAVALRGRRSATARYGGDSRDCGWCLRTCVRTDAEINPRRSADLYGSRVDARPSRPALARATAVNAGHKMAHTCGIGPDASPFAFA
jgi:hypothetical protein